jgi:hypothetical protein
MYREVALATMPNRAPSYYHWSETKPVTTNDIYGYHLKHFLDDKKGKAPKKQGPFDYTRPFSSAGFLPAINGTSKSLQEIRLGGKRPCPSLCLPGLHNHYNIRQGYSMGYMPVSSRIAHSDVPRGVNLNHTTSAPAPYALAQPKGKDLYMWHALAGSLVHTKNYKPTCSVDSYAINEGMY